MSRGAAPEVPVKIPSAQMVNADASESQVNNSSTTQNKDKEKKMQELEAKKKIIMEGTRE